MKTEASAVSWDGGFYQQYPECHQVWGQALQCQSLAGDCKSAPQLMSATLQFSVPASRAGGMCWGIQWGQEERVVQLPAAESQVCGVKGLCAVPHGVNVCYHECH